MLHSQIESIVSKSPKWVVVSFIAVPLVLLIVLLKAAGAGQVAAQPVQPLPQNVDVFALQQKSAYTRLIDVIGRVESNKRAVIGFERGGTVAQSYVDEGDYVAKGDLLAELDTQRLQAQLLEIEAAIKRAEADARLAKLSEKRIAKLVQDKLESPQRLDETRESTLAANALVQEIIARKESVMVEFEKSKLYAPFDGAILSRPVYPGSVVAQGTTVFTMQQNENTEVRMAMAAKQAFSLGKGTVYEMTDGVRTFSAKLKSVASARTLNTRTVDAIFELQDAQLPLAERVLPGDLLNLQLPQQINADGFWVPKSALTNGIRGMWNLFTVAELGADQNIVAKSVSVLYSDDKRAFVSGALTNNEYVVMHGGHRLVPDQLVVATEVNVSAIARR
ncbi:MAG: efflux RND transporter periplasmic adaptor subunit [Alteromonadaceae bacterium]|nr:efflux RND transporter periplasmic adaptor subunit [Alteromonadaceae bacterium]